MRISPSHLVRAPQAKPARDQPLRPWLAILVGVTGLHRLLAGQWFAGLAMLAVTGWGGLATHGWAMFLVGVIGLLDGLGSSPAHAGDDGLVWGFGLASLVGCAAMSTLPADGFQPLAVMACLMPLQWMALLWTIRRSGRSLDEASSPSASQAA